MIGVRLTAEYERKLVEMAKKAGMRPGPYVRRLVIAHVEAQSQAGGDSSLDAKFDTIQRGLAMILSETRRNGRSIETFLDAAEIVDH